ncbi:hypothetical protein ACTFIW_003149 [Dictyostelium discoideum]
MDIKKREYDNSTDQLGSYGENNDSKRLKLEIENEIDKSIEPSPVIHCRGLPYSVTDADIHALLSPFGKVEAVCLMRMGQALIEMDSIQTSTSIISRSITKPFILHNQKILFAYSKSQHLNNSKKNQPIAQTGSQNIILCTILNPIYPITTNTIHNIMSPYGRVIRIVIFQKKSGLQTFVEFDSPYSAWAAKESLNGQDIYNGGCKLQIEFARVSKLNVKQNDDKTADYTAEFYQMQQQQQMASLGSPYGMPTQGGPMGNPFSTVPHHHGSMGHHHSPFTSVVGGGGGGGAPMGIDKSMMYSQSAMSSYMYNIGGQESLSQPVILVNRLPETLDTDKLFNLFCLYGNVIKIKMLHNTKGSAMVQMGDSVQAEIAIQCLNQSSVYGQKIGVFHTKYQYIVESEKTRDYSKSTLNRFLNNQPYGKNAYKPSPTLHFLNVPLNFTEKQLIDEFTNFGTHTPTHCKFFPTKPESTKLMGLLEFPDSRLATEALMDLNNHKITGNVLKLSFTMNTIHKTEQTQPLQPPQPPPNLS